MTHSDSACSWDMMGSGPVRFHNGLGPSASDFVGPRFRLRSAMSALASAGGPEPQLRCPV
jgi:hypothetical protein